MQQAEGVPLPPGGGAAVPSAALAAAAPLSIQLSSGKSLSMKSQDLASVGELLVCCAVLRCASVGQLWRMACGVVLHHLPTSICLASEPASGLPSRRSAAGGSSTSRSHSGLSDVSEAAPTPTGGASAAPYLPRSRTDVGGGATVTTLPRSFTAATRPSASSSLGSGNGGPSGSSTLMENVLIEPGGRRCCDQGPSLDAGLVLFGAPSSAPPCTEDRSACWPPDRPLCCCAGKRGLFRKEGARVVLPAAEGADSDPRGPGEP